MPAQYKRAATRLARAPGFGAVSGMFRSSVHRLRALGLKLLGRPDGPGADALFGQALALHQQGEPGRAAVLYGEALAADPGHFGALSCAGILAYQSGRAGDAAGLLRRALAVDPGQAGVHSNLALALNAVGAGLEAIEACDRAIALDPACIEAWSNRGNSLWGLGRRDEALESYARALALQADHAQTHWNEGFLRLQLGQFEAGWQKQEWRWQLPHLAAGRRAFAQPLWLGKEDLAGRTILLHAEQGLGDTLLMCRYAKLVAARGARVVLEVQPPLRALLSRLEGPAEVIARGDPLPAFDFHCPLMSLPLAFGTTLATVPSERAYLSCDPAELAQWRERLGPATRPRIGLVWQGTVETRSVALAEMLRIVGPAAQFFSFQHGATPADQALLEAHPEIDRTAAGLRDFGDAPLVALMDLVVSVDTSVAHLAGGLGVPAWVLLQHNPDWRWMLGREDSPWYPGTRLYRQDAPGDWTGALARVARDIESGVVVR